MKKTAFLTCVSVIAVSAFSALGAQAQDVATVPAQPAAEQAPPEETDVGAVTVTGSFLPQAAEQRALPVDILTAEEQEKKGNPTILETVKSMTASSGVLGESNQFGSGSGQYGRATVNLRGLGSARTLVLLNGKRLADGDLNTIPTASISRIEVLKEGAATTYGSDAIGGVLNFITRRPFTGVEVNGNYRAIRGSAGGDYGGGIVAGLKGESSNLLVSFDYAKRSDLSTMDRDWAVRPFSENPEGGWTAASNPSRFIPVNGAYANTGSATSQRDVGCLPLGGIVTGDGLCRAQYITWDNLVDEEVHYQAYGEANIDLTSNIRAHVEVLYGRTTVPGVNATPSFAISRGPSTNAFPTSYPTTGTFVQGASPANNPPISNFFYVPLSNPGYAAYCGANPTQCPAGTTGALIPTTTFRPFLLGGNPAALPTAQISNIREQTRVSAGLKGDLGEIGFLGGVGWQADVTYSQYDNKRDERDVAVNRLQLALQGLGGASCPYANATTHQLNLGNAGNAMLGCYYFNPLSNAIASNPNLGLTNPGYNAAVANTNVDLINWFYTDADQARASTTLYEGNLIFNGASTFKLPGGNIAYAVGAQWRREGFNSNPAAQSSLQQTPCTDSLTPLLATSATCSPQLGPFGFLGQINTLDISRDIYAGFVEVSLPISDRIGVTIAGRYEDYGDFGGSTTNPKASLRWQLTDNWAFRTSYSTTFRAPPQASLIPNTAVGLRNVLGTFRGVASTGNPNLKPETADNYNVGLLFEGGGLHASLDYYNFKLSSVLGSEVLADVVNAVYPNGAAGANNCATIDPTYLANHFSFGSGGCAGADISLVKLLQINSGTIETDGFDMLVDYRIPTQFWGADTGVGGTLTYINEYVVNGVNVAGLANSFGSGAAGPMPRLKGELYGEVSKGRHNLRLTVRYNDRYLDDRQATFTQTAANTQLAPTPSVAASTLTTAGQVIASQSLFDLAYRVKLPADTTMTVVVQNIFDRDPPFARAELSYDPLTGNPLGRTVQVSLRKAF